MKKRTLTLRAARRIAERTAKNAAARENGANETRPVLARARYISQLELLRSRGNLSARQYEAGDKFYRDWRTSGSEPRLVPAYDREIGCGGDGYNEYQIEARSRFEQALQAIGPRCRDVVVHVCLLDCKVAEYNDLERLYQLGVLTEEQVRARWVKRLSKADVMDRLKDGLNDLSVWYESVRRNERLDELQSESVMTC